MAGKIVKVDIGSLDPRSQNALDAKPPPFDQYVEGNTKYSPHKGKPSGEFFKNLNNMGSENYDPMAMMGSVGQVMGVSEETAKKIKHGVGMYKRAQGAPKLIQSPGDKVEEHGNALMKYGRDQLAYGVCDKTRGIGASGDMNTACMTLVAGGGILPHEKTPRSYGTQGPLHRHLNTEKDAAFIHVGERVGIGIDKALGIAKATSTMHTRDRSGIGIKADKVAIAAREGIVLCGSRTEIRNSKKGLSTSVAGVTILGPNSKKGVESMVKGESLVTALVSLNEHVGKLNGVLMGFLTTQIIYNVATMNHTHFSPFFAVPTTMSPECWIAGSSNILFQFQTCFVDAMWNSVNLVMWELNYMYDFGAGYVCSRWNQLN